MKKTAIVYHYLAHYRLAVFQELMKSKQIEYHLISDIVTTDGIKGIDPELAKIPVEMGGLRWHFVDNKWYKHTFLWQKGLFKELYKGSYDEVLFLGNIYYISTWFSIAYLKLKNKKIYFWTHGVTSNEVGLKWQLRKFFYSCADKVLLYGNNAKKVMVKNGFSEQQLEVVFNSLNYDTQIKFRNKINQTVILKTKKQLFKDPSLPNLVFVGRLTAQKKLDMVINALNILESKNIQLNLLFVGDGSAKNILQKMATEIGLNEKIVFYGSCYDEEKLSQLIGSSDICVSPGEVGLTAMTALGYGTPVISHDNFNHQMPEYEAIVPGKNGDLFKHNSTEDLADKIASWLTRTTDLEREQIQNQCFKIIDEKYNPKNQAKIITALSL